MIEKIARLCWNTHDWKRPSGSEGKSLSDSSYEKIVGFGHEEWLLDDSKILPDGYHYGFLQPMNVKSQKHAGMVYDIHLFAISPRKQKVYIGCLRNAIGVSIEESKKAYEYYKANGWIEEMKQDIKYVGGIIKDLKPSMMFNVKFRFEDAEINYSNQPILRPDSIGHRYNLMEKVGDFEYEIDDEGNIETLDTSLITRTTKAGEILIDPLHKKIQNAIVELLKDQYVHLYVEKGTDCTIKQKVDIKGLLKDSEEWHYFEVKTYSAKRSIREALGQILEYAHYPSTKRAKKLFIIGPEKPDDKDKSYMQFIRKTYGLPIWFRWYSFAENKLYEEI